MSRHIIPGWSTILAAFAILVLASSGFSLVPPLINYQGRLTDASGNPLNGTYSIRFTIYIAPAGGSYSWQETQPSVAVSNGLFNVQLGSVVALPDIALADTTRYLGIKVGADPELLPRTKLTCVPYAYRARTVDGALGGTIFGYQMFYDTLGRGLAVLPNAMGATLATQSPDGFYNNILMRYGVTTLNGMTWINGPVTNAALLVSGGSAVISDSVAIGSGGAFPQTRLDVMGGNWNVAGSEGDMRVGNSSYRLKIGIATAGGGAGLCRVYAAGGMATLTLGSGTNDVLSVSGTNVGIGTIYPSQPLSMGGGAYCNGTTWVNFCDRNHKTNFQSLDGADVLERIEELPITRWSYTADKHSVTHIGPTAQDFYAAFGTGNDTTTISTIDPPGVALVAIKELIKRNDDLAAQNAQLKAELAELSSAVKALQTKAQSR